MLLATAANANENLEYAKFGGWRNNLNFELSRVASQ
jgi:hypothetical protein